jgi:hypothetical protein
VVTLRYGGVLIEMVEQRKREKVTAGEQILRRWKGLGWG